MAPAPGAAGQQTGMRRAEGLLTVNVPEEAKIFVNGQATTSTGSTRQYVSRDLQNGLTYAYEVRAEIVRDGQTLEQTKTIDLRAGATSSLAFDFDGAQPVETSLTVRVPAEAKVFLAGNATTASGETRVFKTTGLSNGKGWNNYTVRVEMERDGKLVTEEKVINLAAGETKELSFFEVEKVASNR
jgi:uncharacterized protein (TIGR03000 family)